MVLVLTWLQKRTVFPEIPNPPAFSLSYMDVHLYFLRALRNTSQEINMRNLGPLLCLGYPALLKVKSVCRDDFSACFIGFPQIKLHHTRGHNAKLRSTRTSYFIKKRLCAHMGTHTQTDQTPKNSVNRIIL